MAADDFDVADVQVALTDDGGAAAEPTWQRPMRLQSHGPHYRVQRRRGNG